MPLAEGFATQPAPDRHRWRIVRRTPGLRGEAKLAWQDIWEEIGGLPGIVRVSPSWLCAQQGTTDAAGRRALEALIKAGYLHLINKDQGHWEIEVRDPVEVKRVRGMTRPDDPALFDKEESDDDQLDGEVIERQGVIPLGTRAEPAAEASTRGSPDLAAAQPPAFPAVVAAEAPTHPPAEASTQPLRLCLTLNNQGDLSPTLNTKPLEVQCSEKIQGRGGSGDTTADASADPLAIGGVLGSIVGRLPSTEDRLRDAARWEQTILARVADARLKIEVARRVARAIVFEGLPEHEVLSLLESLDKARCRPLDAGGLRTAPWCYFYKTMRNPIFPRNKLTW